MRRRLSQVNAGYQFTNNWAAEMAYTDLGDDTTRVTIKGIGLISLSNTFDMFAQMGLSFVDDNKSDHNEQVVMAGLGIKYRMTSNTSIRLLYDLHDDDIALPQLGLQYNF